jgi:hypothetical protein
MSVKIFDLDNTVNSFFGFLIDSGFGEDKCIKVERESAAFTKKTSADGEVARSKTRNKTATITITLMNTSKHNDQLSAVALLDELGHNGAGVGPFLMKDLSGTSLMAGTCWVEQRPDVDIGREAYEVEWKLGAVISFEHQGGAG